MNDVPKWSLSQDSQCSQAGALKNVPEMVLMLLFAM